MPRDFNTIKKEYDAIVAENNKRIAARDALYDQLDKEFGTHDKAELQAILENRRKDAEDAEAAYNDALAKIDEYVKAAREALGL